MAPTTAPSPVSNAVTMAHVSAGVVGAFWCVALAQVATGNGGIQSWLFLLTLPGVIGLERGAWVLRRCSRPTPLVVSAVVTAVVLLGTALAGFVAYRESAFVAFAAGPLLLLPLPVVAASLSGAPRP